MRGDGMENDKVELEAWPYFNAGRWVADCPNGCGNAWIVVPGEDRFVCYAAPRQLPGGAGMTEAIGCRAPFLLRWPADPAAAMRQPAPRAKTASQLAYEEAARREHEAQHTDHEGDEGDGQEKTNAATARRLERHEKNGADDE